jgi:hypothetical protein
MTFLSPLVAPIIRGACCIGLAGTLAESIIYPNPSAHKTLTGRAMMQGTITALAYLSNMHISDNKGTTSIPFNIGLFTIGFFGLMRVADTVLNGTKQFESLIGRVRETAVSLGTFSALLHVGSSLGIGPQDTFNYTSIALSYAAEYLLKGLSYVPRIVSLAAGKLLSIYSANTTET